MTREKGEPFPFPKKITLIDRVQSENEKEAFQVLEERARALETKLFQAFGSTPSAREATDAIHNVLEELIMIAKDARIFSRQYRGFAVGAVVLGFRKTSHPGRNPWRIMFDANTKPTVHDAKWCAEQYLMDRALTTEEKFARILAFIVVGEPQTDDDSKRTQITLTPCKQCRDRMLLLTEGDTPLIARNTEVITAHAKQTAFRKYQHVKDLSVFHKEYVEFD